MMAQVCARCARTNPAEAVYCYFDGMALQGTSVRASAPAGSRPFPAPFVFPSGRACANFDGLARGCLDEWETALDLLKQGSLEKFLFGLGRGDLAQAAQQAAQFPDPDRGLDQLLARLP